MRDSVSFQISCIVDTFSPREMVLDKPQTKFEKKKIQFCCQIPTIYTLNRIVKIKNGITLPNI